MAVINSDKNNPITEEECVVAKAVYLHVAA